MSTIDDQDRFIIQRGLTTYQLPASNMSTIQGDDWLLISRGSDHYKVSGADVLSQLGGEDGGGDSTRASFNILEGPGAGTTVDLLDYAQFPNQEFVFENGATYVLEFMDNFVCTWDLVGQGGHGGSAPNGNSTEYYSGVVGLATSLIFPAWNVIAGGGEGGYGCTGRAGAPGTGGYARITGDVPGVVNGLAVTSSADGTGAAAGGGSGASGQTAPSPYPPGGLFPAGVPGEGRGGSGSGPASNKAGNGGGGGSAAYVRLSMCLMTRRAQCQLQVGEDNAAAGIRYTKPARVLLGSKRERRQQRQ